MQRVSIFLQDLDEYNFDSDRQMLEVNLIGAFAWLNPIAAMFQSAKRRPDSRHFVRGW